jgi:transcriptional regulator with XRE-family HTH domain
MTQADWPKAVTLDVAREVRRWRTRRKLSTEQLSALTAEGGHQIHRSVLANLESGRRENITVPDLVSLGRALGVPPLMLLYPVGREPDSEVAPGIHADPWEAAKLFTGEMANDGSMAAAEDLGLFREHDRLVRAWQRATEAAAERPPSDDDLLGGLSAPSLAKVGLLQLRARMIDRGLLLPALPDGLAAQLASAE